MTIEELRNFINEGALDYRPEWITKGILEVDSETYLNALKEIINFKIDGNGKYVRIAKMTVIPLTVGPNRGLYFKGIELILKN